MMDSKTFRPDNWYIRRYNQIFRTEDSEDIEKIPRTSGISVLAVTIASRPAGRIRWTTYRLPRTQGVTSTTKLALII
jgi:hypothetical protein